MKSFFCICTVGVAMLISRNVIGQDNPAASSGSIGHDYSIAISEFPSNNPINYIEGWGGMAVAVNEMPAGTNLAPLLEGLKNNSCQVPHWGYIIKGVLRLRYDDGREDVLKAGDLFYMPPGHIAIVEEDMKMMDFSPEKGFKKVVSHIEKKIAEASQHWLFYLQGLMLIP